MTLPKVHRSNVGFLQPAILLNVKMNVLKNVLNVLQNGYKQHRSPCEIQEKLLEPEFESLRGTGILHTN